MGVDASGNLVTIAAGGGGGGGSPGGADTQIQFNNSGSFAGSSNFVWSDATSTLTVTGDIAYSGVITDTSDRRLKTNIKVLDSAELLKRIQGIDLYSFQMKSNPSGQAEMGVMAQELELIFPEFVRTARDKMGTKSVNYIGLITPLIGASKQLKVENDELKAKNEKLERQIASLCDVVDHDRWERRLTLILIIMVGFFLIFRRGRK